jgi:protein-tyrosine phosphatase
MFDMHSHIIPAIDDGATDLEVSLEMLRLAHQRGTTDILATPHAIRNHWFPKWDTVVSACEHLNQKMQKLKLGIRSYPGAEVFMDMDTLAELTGPGPYCINNGKYMLVELPAAEIPRFADDFFFTLQTRGITPVLAHAERHPELAKQPAILQEWIRKGLLVQMNGSSLLGRTGERVMKTAEMLIRNNMVHCIGSDAHGITRRRPDLAEAVVKLKTMVDSGYAHKLLVENPQRMMHSLDIELQEPVMINNDTNRSGVRGWLTKIFG